MQIYIADLSAYNAGYLKGEWIQLPTEEDEINDALLRQSQNGKSDYAIHDWELPFKISEYTNPLKINEICTILKDLDINESLINHIEYAYGIDIKNTDYKTLSNYIDDIYTIEASNDIEFAQLKMLCDDVFGEENFLNIISVNMKNIAGASGGGEDKKFKKNCWLGKTSKTYN